MIVKRAYALERDCKTRSMRSRDIYEKSKQKAQTKGINLHCLTIEKNHSFSTKSECKSSKDVYLNNFAQIAALQAKAKFLRIS